MANTSQKNVSVRLSVPMPSANPVVAEDVDQVQANIDRDLGGAPVVEVTRGKFEKTIDQRAEAEDSFEMDDPVKEAIAQHGRPGFVNRLLSERVMKRKGNRGWRIVKDSKGDPVEVGGMILGEMPEGKAKARTAKFQQESREYIQTIKESYQQQQEKIKRESGLSKEDQQDAVTKGSSETIVREYNPV